VRLDRRRSGRALMRVLLRGWPGGRRRRRRGRSPHHSPLVESARCLDGIRDDDALRDRRGEDAQPSCRRGLGQVLDPCSPADGVLLVLVDEDTGDLQRRVVVGPHAVDGRQELTEAVGTPPLRVSDDHHAVSGRQAVAGELVEVGGAVRSRSGRSRRRRPAGPREDGSRGLRRRSRARHARRRG